MLSPRQSHRERQDFVQALYCLIGIGAELLPGFGKYFSKYGVQEQGCRGTGVQGHRAQGSGHRAQGAVAQGRRGAGAQGAGHRGAGAQGSGHRAQGAGAQGAGHRAQGTGHRAQGHRAQGTGHRAQGTEAQGHRGAGAQGGYFTWLTEGKAYYLILQEFWIDIDKVGITGNNEIFLYMNVFFASSKTSLR